jgi:hypothetical protein
VKTGTVAGERGADAATVGGNVSGDGARASTAKGREGTERGRAGDGPRGNAGGTERERGDGGDRDDERHARRPHHARGFGKHDRFLAAERARREAANRVMLRALRRDERHVGSRRDGAGRPGVVTVAEVAWHGEPCRERVKDDQQYRGRAEASRSRSLRRRGGILGR